MERLSRAGVTIVAIEVVEAMIALTQSCDEEGMKLGSQRESEVLVKELRDLKSMELSDWEPRFRKVRWEYHKTRKFISKQLLLHVLSKASKHQTNNT